MSVSPGAGQPAPFRAEAMRTPPSSTKVGLLPDPQREVLDANRLRVVLDLARRPRAFETRFGFATTDLEAALASGRVTDGI